jgi:nucleoside-diphosphate-sugar epimerase
LECSKAKRLLKWRPKYNLEEGIAKTVEYYKVAAI